MENPGAPAGATGALDVRSSGTLNNGHFSGPAGVQQPRDTLADALALAVAGPDVALMIAANVTAFVAVQADWTRARSPAPTSDIPALASRSEGVHDHEC